MPTQIIDFTPARDLDEICRQIARVAPVRQVPGDLLDRYIERQKEIAERIGATARFRDAFVASAQRKARDHGPGVEYEWTNRHMHARLRVFAGCIYLEHDQGMSEDVERLISSLRPERRLVFDD